MPGQVDGNHAMALEQIRQQLDPVPGRAGEPVQEQERFALSAGVVVDRDPAGDQVFGSSPAKFVAAVMRAEYPPMTMSMSGRGPVDSATNDERAMSEPA